MHRPDSSTLQNDYWPDGTLKSQTDGANQTTNYTYDTLGSLASVTDPNNRTTSYTSDPLGNVVSKTDPGGSCSGTASGCTQYSYDTFNQLVAADYSDPDTPNVAYTYDGNGQRLSMTESLGGVRQNSTSWTWDSLHRITAQTTNRGPRR